MGESHLQSRASLLALGKPLTQGSLVAQYLTHNTHSNHSGPRTLGGFLLACFPGHQEAGAHSAFRAPPSGAATPQARARRPLRPQASLGLVAWRQEEEAGVGSSRPQVGRGSPAPSSCPSGLRVTTASPQPLKSDLPRWAVPSSDPPWVPSSSGSCLLLGPAADSLLGRACCQGHLTISCPWLVASCLLTRPTLPHTPVCSPPVGHQDHCGSLVAGLAHTCPRSTAGEASGVQLWDGSRCKPSPGAVCSGA